MYSEGLSKYMNEETKQQLLEQTEDFMRNNDIPYGADAAFFAGAKYVLNLIEQ